MRNPLPHRQHAIRHVSCCWRTTAATAQRRHFTKPLHMSDPRLPHTFLFNLRWIEISPKRERGATCVQGGLLCLVAVEIAGSVRAIRQQIASGYTPGWLSSSFIYARLVVAEKGSPLIDKSPSDSILVVLCSQHHALQHGPTVNIPIIPMTTRNMLDKNTWQIRETMHTLRVISLYIASVLKRRYIHRHVHIKTWWAAPNTTISSK